MAELMQAVQIVRFGEPSELTIEPLPKPECGEQEVLVQVHATTVNPSDLKMVQGLPPRPKLPTIPGQCFAGVIVEGAEEHIGKQVWGYGGEFGVSRLGCQAEFLLLPVAAISEKPKSLTMEQAAAACTGFITAWICVVERGRLSKGERILIVGGSGAVGSAAAQISKQLGGIVLVTTMREAYSDNRWRKNIDSLINLQIRDLYEAVMTETERRGVEVVLNTVGGPTFEPALRSVRQHGCMVCISAMGDTQVQFDLLEFYRKEVALLGVNTNFVNAVMSAKILDQLRPGFDSGVYYQDVAETFPLDKAAQAYRRVEEGGRGKVVLTMV